MEKIKMVIAVPIVQSNLAGNLSRPSGGIGNCFCGKRVRSDDGACVTSVIGTLLRVYKYTQKQFGQVANHQLMPVSLHFTALALPLAADGSACQPKCSFYERADPAEWQPITGPGNGCASLPAHLSTTDSINMQIRGSVISIQSDGGPMRRLLCRAR